MQLFYILAGFVFLLLLADGCSAQFSNGALTSSCVSLGEEGFTAADPETNPYSLSVVETVGTATNRRFEGNIRLKAGINCLTSIKSINRKTMYHFSTYVC